jgi:photosystem II stability/assembly factor-like uncharacterized protein
MRKLFVPLFAVFVLVAVAAAYPHGESGAIDPRLFSGLVWRNIGPFRGGRISAVSGAVGQPGVFYIGLPLGGVWKTTSAGETWFPVMDDVKEASSVGAVAVAPSDPNVIYVGMGDIVTGGGINEGNGVYKSTDAGKTWQHLGLDETKQIPRILIDPKNPDLVMVAAQGNIHTHSEERGLYRSTDGGKTWKKTLYVDNQTGVQDISWAFDNPGVMLLTTVRHYTDPLAPRGGGAGGGGGGAQPPQGPTGTSLYKSTDEGLTWTEIKGNGLPTLTGRTATAIAIGTRSQRMFFIGTFGFYRSDDGGANWKQMAADDRRIANGQGNYTSGVYLDPKNPDLVYTLATSSYKSIDGGKTFTGFKGAPGGDDPQQMWIDPADGRRMLLGVDQGATVSLDGGQTWSSWYNQATAQVYHISTDTQYPYWVYATQQDSGSIGTRSRGDLGAITPLDWWPTPGYEFGSIVADPLNPKIVYAGGPSAGVVKITYPSGQWVNISPNIVPDDGLRKVGNQPLIFNPTNPKELFAGFQYLTVTTDGGAHWTRISPDLGYPKGVTPPPPPPPGAAPAAPGGGRGGPQAGAIESISPSTIAAGTIWIGTNNGLIKMTKDHGKSWEDVTIPDLPNPTRADMSTIDSSHHDAATAYVAIDYHGVGDYKPYLYRTHDYGKTWTKIVNGLATDQPGGSFMRVVRADTKKKGLLFAGSESSMYVSFDDGDTWQSLMLNLPNTSYRDIAIHDNDLVVGTYGRSFWVLDDISPLRELTSETASEAMHFFKPAEAIRVRRNVNGDTPFPPEVPHAKNPPVGAILYYYLGSKPSSEITLDVKDASGKAIRHLSSAPIPPLKEPPASVPDFWLDVPRPLPSDPGMHRISWDIRHDNTPAFSHSYEINANPGETPASPEGALALPGAYTLELTVDGKKYTQTVAVKNDPRSPASAVDLKAQHDLQMKITDGAALAWDGYRQVTALRDLIKEIAASKTQEVADAAKAFDAKLAAVGGNPQGGRRGGGGFGGPPPASTFVSAQTAMIRHLQTLDSGDMAPNEPIQRAYAATCRELATIVKNWDGLRGSELTAFNAVLAKNTLSPVTVATPAITAPSCSVVAPAASKRSGSGR